MPLPIFLAVYALLYAAFGVQSPFLPALLRERGLRADQISIVLAAGTAIRVLAGPALGHVADRWRTHRRVLSFCAVAAAISGLGYVPPRRVRARSLTAETSESAHSVSHPHVAALDRTVPVRC